MSRKTVIIAGGGTGGHVYPALSVAQALLKIDPDLDIHFVGTERGIEKNVIPQSGFPLHKINVGQLHKSVGLVKRIKTLVSLPFIFLECLHLCRRLRPQFVFGVGGYASGPVVLIASIMRIKTAIWEPNAHPGLANRLLSRFVDKCFVVFDKAKSLLKTTNVENCGIPIRFELDKEKSGQKEVLRLLVFGGSQGARAINIAVFDAVTQFPEKFKNIELVHQIGSVDYEKMKKKYEELLPTDLSEQVEVKQFLEDMQKRYEWADIVICRGGASTFAELMACGLPSIIIPLPTAADDHQRKNAEQMQNANAAKMILQDELDAARLIAVIEDLQKNPQQLKEMGENAKKMHISGAADELAKKLLTL